MPDQKKCAMFIHGYGATSKLWTEGKSSTPGKGPMLELFESFGYQTDHMITLPGSFLDHKKGFDFYACHIAMLVENKVKGIASSNMCPCCGTEFPVEPIPTEDKVDDITLVCHSMGGVAARLYLSDPSIGDPAAKKMVKKLITLGSPHHGTDVLLEEIVSGLLAGLGPLIIPTAAAFIPGVAAALPFAPLASVAVPVATSNAYPIALNAASKGKCYREIQRDTKFIKRLNYELEFPKEIEFYSIWTNGDKISTPIHTAVVDGAMNYYIDDLRVWHMNLAKKWLSVNAVGEILRGTFKAQGLQSYPNSTGCNKVGGHRWQPIRVPLAYKKEYLWKCENQSHKSTCACEEVKAIKPNLTGSDKKGCSVGKLDKDRYMHTWRRTGLKRFECQKCSKSYEGTERPSKWAGSKKCKLPFKNFHRWQIKWNEWKCEECGEIKKSKRKPQFLGCKVGKIRKRHHDWYKVSKKYLYRFECLCCGQKMWHRD